MRSSTGSGYHIGCSVARADGRRMKKLALALVVAFVAGGCRNTTPPIRMNGRTLVVENQTRSEWRNVTVTVNGYYRGSATMLAAGAELDAGLSSFVTGLGQKFDPGRESVHTVE